MAGAKSFPRRKSARARRWQWAQLVQPERMFIQRTFVQFLRLPLIGRQGASPAARITVDRASFAWLWLFAMAPISIAFGDVVAVGIGAAERALELMNNLATG